MVLLIRLNPNTEGQPRYRRLSRVDYILCSLAFLGLAYVTLGTSSTTGESNSYIPHQALVSRVGNSLEICCEGVEYLVCGFVPGEGFGVFVPVVDPGVDGVLEIGY